MFGFLTFLTFVASAAGALFAALSGKAWYESSRLAIPELPKDVAAPTVDKNGKQIPISMMEEAVRRSVLGAAMVAFLEATKRSAEINRSAAWFSMLAAVFAAFALLIPKIQDFGILLGYWPLPT